MKQSRVVWHEWSKVPAEGGAFGHGIHFHDGKQKPEADLVGFIEGFDWLHKRGVNVTGFHIKANSVTTILVLAAMKRRVEQMVANQQMVGDGMISRRIHAIGNC